MAYELRTALPTVAEYRRLRDETGLSPRTAEAARRGLDNTIHGVTVVDDDGSVVGMGRVIGDDGCFYQIVDVAVLPPHQNSGLGTRIVEALVAYLRENAPASAYVSLLADVEGFYERFGFEETAPASKAMAMFVD
jgi:N-acetylglutamate synthase-like GNAT family acetyltransferase